jgi:F1F0 ATPase subunit 2
VINVVTVTVDAVVGLSLGALFFGGLWLTVSRSLQTPLGALILPAGFLVRTAVVLVGFRMVGGDDWRAYAICLAGFLCARYLASAGVRSLPEAKHAA